jgi:hypothetical protein
MVLKLSLIKVPSLMVCPMLASVGERKETWITSEHAQLMVTLVGIALRTPSSLTLHVVHKALCTASTLRMMRSRIYMGVDCGQVLYKVVGYKRKQVNQIAAAPSRKQRISKHDVKHCLAASVKSGEIVGDTDTVSPEFEPILNDTVIFGCRIRVLPWDGLVFELR